jgi:hypothetical protein
MSIRFVELGYFGESGLGTWMRYWTGLWSDEAGLGKAGEREMGVNMTDGVCFEGNRALYY